MKHARLLAGFALLAAVLPAAGCGDPCAPRRDCIRSHMVTIMRPQLVGKTTVLIPTVVRVCDEYGPEYIPAGCPDSGKDKP